MDWVDYKRLCDRPDTWSRWMLRQTRELLAGELASDFCAAVAKLPLAKPADHSGGPETDMFVLHLGVARRLEVLSAVSAAQESGKTTSATTARGLGGFVEAWREYANWKTNDDFGGGL